MKYPTYVDNAIVGHPFKQRMDSLLKEKLKDIIVDYLLDYSHNDKVRIIEGDGSKLTVSLGFKIEDDPVLLAYQ